MAGPGGQEVGRISIRVVPNTDNFRRELKAQLEAIEKSLQGEIEFKADLDTSGLREKVKAAAAAAGKEGIKLELDDKFDYRLRQRLAKIKPKVEVELDVSRSKLDFLRDKIGSIFSGGAGARGGGIPLGSFADSAAMVAAVAALAAPALALISGGLATIPALLSAIVVPISAVALGMDGLKKAAEVLGAPLLALKEVMSQKFQDVFTPIFLNAAGIFPSLARTMPAVADGLGKVADAFVNTIVSGPGLAKIEGTITNIAKAISDSAPGVASLTNGLLGLATGVSAKFPAVAQWFNEAADSFSKWVDKASADGSLDRAMGNLGKTVKGLLDIVGDLAKQGFEFLQDPEFGASMERFVASTKSLINDVLPGLKDFFMDLESALTGITTAIDTIKAHKPPEWLLPDSKPEGEPSKSGAGGRDNGTDLLPQWKNNLANLISSVNLPLLLANQFAAGNALDGALQGIKQRGIAAFQGIATSIAPAMAGAFANVQTIAAGAWNGLVGVASNVVAQVVAQFAQVPGKIGGALSAVVGVAQGVFAQVVGVVVSAGAQMVAAIVNVGVQIAAEAATWGGKIAAACGNFGSILVGAGQALMDGLLSGIKSALAGVLAFVGTIAAQIAAKKGPLNYDKTVLTPNGQALMQGLQDGIEGGLQGVLDRARLIAGQIADAINSGTAGVDLGMMPDQLKRSLDELELTRKDLKVQKDLIPKEDKAGRSAIQSQMDQIQTLKDQLNLQKDQLGFSEKYGESVDQNAEGNNMLGDSLTKMVDIGKGFAMANANQFMSDLGIGGNGAIPQLANIGLDWASGLLSQAISGGMGGGTTIQVNSIEEGLAAKQNLANKQALQYRTR
jgi:hypothetical protein